MTFLTQFVRERGEKSTHTRAYSNFKLTQPSSNTSPLLGDRPSCPECSKTFYNPTLLNKHILQEHKRDTRLACPICNQFYLRKNNLDDHIKTAHRDEDKLVCKLCEGKAPQVYMFPHCYGKVRGRLIYFFFTIFPFPLPPRSLRHQRQPL